MGEAVCRVPRAGHGEELAAEAAPTKGWLRAKSRLRAKRL